jgi:hypothetical protein
MKRRHSSTDFFNPADFWAARKLRRLMHNPAYEAGSMTSDKRKFLFVSQAMRQAQAQAYSRPRNTMISDMCYRDDIGEHWFEDHDKPHTWGYLREV